MKRTLLNAAASEGCYKATVGGEFFQRLLQGSAVPTTGGQDESLAVWQKDVKRSEVRNEGILC